MRLPLIFILILAACGPQKSDTGDESSDTGTGSDTGTPTGSDTGTPTGTGTDTGTGTGTGTGTDTGTSSTEEPLSCDVFLPPPPDAFKKVAISIVSELDEPVWIGAVGCGGLPLLRIFGADAEDLYDNPEGCYPLLCDQFLGLEDCTPGCDDCASAIARRVPPGSVTTVNWSAARSVPMQMTAACAPGVDCQRECFRPEPVAAGTYTVELTAFRSCAGPCECDAPDPDVSCPLWDSIVMAEPFDVKATISYPEDDGIKLVLSQP
jgi:hypothetical protein